MATITFMSIDDLRDKSNITRQDITDLLKSIGASGEKRDEKIEAMKSLERSNRQGHSIEETLHSYEEF